MSQAWTQEQKQHILDEYRRTLVANCPLDRMPLDITDGGPGDPRAITFTCTKCGNTVASNQI
jgi:hypothetical protein